MGEGAELAGDDAERRAPEFEAEEGKAEPEARAEAEEAAPPAPADAPDPRRSTAYLSVITRAELAPDVDLDI